MFKGWVPSSVGKHCVSIANTNWLMVFREITSVYSENDLMKSTDTLFGKIQKTLNFSVSDTYSYSALNWLVS
jgi:hypothetical protein